jgi:hypothetical protein
VDNRRSLPHLISLVAEFFSSCIHRMISDRGGAGQVK